VAGEPTINPYAPPAASIEPVGGPVPVEDRFDRPLFSPRQIGVAAFFGSVLAGVMLLQANFRVMRRSGAANKTLVLGALVTFALIVVLQFVPRGVSTPINIAIALTMSKLAESLQGDDFFRHTIAGGAKRSNWLVFGIIIGTLVVLITTLVAIGIVAHLASHTE